MMKWLVVAICLAYLAGSFAENEVPIFIWGDTEVSSSPVLNSDASVNLEQVLSGDNFNVIFVESQLSSDDFNRCEVNGKSCFAFLGRQTSKFYSPNIESPSSFLNTRIWNGEVETVNSDEKITKEAGKTVFVHFEDSQEFASHAEKLAAHDETIKEIVTKLGVDKTTYVYTGVESSHSLRRVARQAKQEEVDEEPFYMFNNKISIIVFRQLAIMTMGEEREYTNATLDAITGTSTVEDGPPDSESKLFKITLTTSLGELNIDIVNASARWWVDSITLGDRHYTNGEWMGGAQGFSYSCYPETLFASPNSTTPANTNWLVFRGLQLEVSDSNPNETMVFSPDFNCVGFTSGGIWGGLFVSFILLFIMSIGITWMMDIKTMDRFDDPKGKTITINAAD